jgi:replicative DNA helicase
MGEGLQLVTTDSEPKLPPYSLDDECAIIACVLEDAANALPECGRVNLDCFYDERCRSIWGAIEAMRDKSEPVDMVTINRKLRERNPAIAGELSSFIMQFIVKAPVFLTLNHFLPSLFDYATKRRVIRGCARLDGIARNGVTGAELMAKCEQLLAIERPNETATLGGKDAGLVLLSDLERRFALDGKMSGLPTGFHSLDAKLDGLQYGEQTIIAARPSKGKTALGLGVFYKTAVLDKIPALFVSLEMSTAALMRRMFSSHAEIGMGEIRRGSYTGQDFNRMTTFAGLASKSPMHIHDGVTGMTIHEVCCQVRKNVRKHGVKLVVVDYLQKIRPDSRHEKRTYEIADVSGKLRSLAVETGAAFLTLAQLSRESEKEKGRPPRISDLGDSGQIERDADTVILIHHTEDIVKLIIGKQRDGETGVAYVTFNGKYCRFENPKQDQPQYDHD